VVVYGRTKVDRHHPLNEMAPRTFWHSVGWVGYLKTGISDIYYVKIIVIIVIKPNSKDAQQNIVFGYYGYKILGVIFL